VPIATATGLYGSAQGEETQHATACLLCYHQHGCLIFSSLTPPQPISRKGKKVQGVSSSRENVVYGTNNGDNTDISE